MRSVASTLNINQWPGTIKLLNDNNTGNIHPPAIFWDNTGLVATDGNPNPPNAFFIGGPSNSPSGDYWFGLQNGYGPGIQNSYVLEIYGQTRANEPAQGSVQFYGNVLVDTGRSVGIGTILPTAQLHTTGGVRFQGLTTGGTVTNIVGIDANGNLWRTTPGVQNLCATTNFLPKTGTGSNLNCSQVFDNGTSVGIGVSSGFSYTWPGGLSGPTPPPATGTLKLAINGVTRALAYFATSDRRLKKDITPVKDALTSIKKLNGVRYKWDSQKYPEMNFTTEPQVGFIAQDVKDVVPEAVIQDQNGYYSINYSALIPLLNEGIKEQQTIIEEMKNEIADLKKDLINLKTKAGLETVSGKYFKVSPNPFSQSTTIRYNLPANSSKALMIVYDLQGTIVKRIEVRSGAQGNITFQKENLSAGAYFISLLVNNVEMQSEKIVLAY